MPQNNLPLFNEYKPHCELILKETILKHPKFPAIDFHCHLGGLFSEFFSKEQPVPKPSVAEAVEEFKNCGIKRIVNLDGFWDGFLGMSVKELLGKLKTPDDFILTFVSVNTNLAKEPGFEAHVREHIRKSYELGARGIKLFKHVSIMIPDGKGGYMPGRNIAIDDERLNVIWDCAAELDIPVLAHIGDPPAFFSPADEKNERLGELLWHPDWQFGEAEGMYTFEELMQMQCNLLEKNPSTTFVIPHTGSYSENLAEVGKWLDRYPNMYIDIAERINELGRQPHTSRRFFIKYQDRILFGSDAFPGNMELRYPGYFRFLETWDDCFNYSNYEGQWKICGLGLPDDVLEKIYFRNAEKLLKL